MNTTTYAVRLRTSLLIACSIALFAGIANLGLQFLIVAGTRSRLPGTSLLITVQVIGLGLLIAAIVGLAMRRFWSYSALLGYGVCWAGAGLARALVAFATRRRGFSFDPGVERPARFWWMVEEFLHTSLFAVLMIAVAGPVVVRWCRLGTVGQWTRGPRLAMPIHAARLGLFLFILCVLSCIYYVWSRFAPPPLVNDPGNLDAMRSIGLPTIDIAIGFWTVAGGLGLAAAISAWTSSKSAGTLLNAMAGTTVAAMIAGLYADLTLLQMAGGSARSVPTMSMVAMPLLARATDVVAMAVAMMSFAGALGIRPDGWDDSPPGPTALESARRAVGVPGGRWDGVLLRQVVAVFPHTLAVAVGVSTLACAGRLLLFSGFSDRQSVFDKLHVGALILYLAIAAGIAAVVALFRNRDLTGPLMLAYGVLSLIGAILMELDSHRNSRGQLYRVMVISLVPAFLCTTAIWEAAKFAISRLAESNRPGSALSALTVAGVLLAAACGTWIRRLAVSSDAVDSLISSPYIAVFLLDLAMTVVAVAGLMMLIAGKRIAGSFMVAVAIGLIAASLLRLGLVAGDGSAAAATTRRWPPAGVVATALDMLSVAAFAAIVFVVGRLLTGDANQRGFEAIHQ